MLPKRVTGLPRDSVAKASQIATVNKDDLDALVTTLPAHLMERVGIGWLLRLDS